MISMWYEYCDWLLDKVGFLRADDLLTSSLDGRQAHVRPNNYKLLMRKLHDIDFKWIIERDENRMKDGLAIRYSFFDDNEVDGGFTRPCSVLEMMVALANRLDQEYIGDPGDPHPEYLFWDMICNLGLDRFYNNNYDESEVVNIIDIWLNRQFKSDGFMSLFPLNNVTFDCREAEIWSLAMAYITENY